MNDPALSIRVFLFCWALVFSLIAGEREAAIAAGPEVDEIRQMAELGSMEFQFRLWEIYLSGAGVAADKKEALKWLQSAAQRGYPPALETLGREYFCGGLVVHDFPKALHLLELAGKRKRAGAGYLLGLMYLNGLGVHPDREKGLDWMIASADQDYPPALGFLSRAYFQGDFVRQDKEKAIVYAVLAANEDSASAQHFLGRVYLQGDGVPADTEEARKWLLRAAKSEYPPAQNDLAFFYVTDEFGMHDIGSAESWLRRAAARNENSARHNLWILYRDGILRPETDAELLAWLKAAAENGDGEAQVNLAHRYLHLQGTRSRLSPYASRRLALYWFHRSAREGNLEAQEILGEIYLDGPAKSGDPALAFLWTFLAAENGSSTAHSRMESIRSRIPPEEAIRAEIIAKRIHLAKKKGAERKSFLFSKINFFSDLPDSICRIE